MSSSHLPFSFLVPTPLGKFAYDPAGLACKYSRGSDSGGSIDSNGRPRGSYDGMLFHSYSCSYDVVFRAVNQLLIM